MRKKVRKTRKPVRKSATKTRRKRKAPPRKSKIKRIRRSNKSTQVTGADIDETFEDLLNKTPLERKIDEQAEQNEDSYSNTLLAVHYDEHDPLDPDDDYLDDEPENRRRMYEVPPKPRSPDKSSSAGQEAKEATEAKPSNSNSI